MEIRRVDSDAELEDALSVRRTVFINEQGVPEHRELDGMDAEATHFVAYDDDEPIGTARLRRYDGDDRSTAKIERVAVIEARRAEGIGRDLMCAVERAAREIGYEKLVLHAQVPVVSFYTELGYKTVGEEFEDAGIPHREMTKVLR
ncbi:GNAT family N-acetyltransferase [Natronomonas salsuginis]|jgi:predicted GNAT family N-acyltransferase|uniref:GNAT family N-acetyltransferase n=1 Tax=Natronomonas salsuginis TaxID=2217661 RepID=A0A4U5JIF6_9EURY|nr:GNAT family N-acetyltransferase [Natronomonas salsuginis]TKR27848.1 GNAT family N-acetyltransferase [Natronomonas salsuginis]